MRAGEIRLLARRAGVRAGATVLDLCCGLAGPGRMVAGETGCDYLGVDYSADALRIARRLAGRLPCRFEQGAVPPVPDGPFEVVMLLETMLAIADKAALFAAVANCLEPGGRFAFTVEAGHPLTADERARMPDADTVWLIELSELTELLCRAGLGVTWLRDSTADHGEMATALLNAYRSDAEHIADGVGARAAAELIAAHELWSEWLTTGRVRKFAVVAEKIVAENIVAEKQ